MVNASIECLALRLFFDARREMMYAKEDGDAQRDFSVHAQEFFRFDDLISIKLAYEGWFGGSYSNRGLHTLNFGGADFGKFKLSEIYFGNEPLIECIFRHCAYQFSKLDIDLQQYVANAYSISSEGSKDYCMSWIDKFNFDREGVTFYFDEFLPHAVESFSAFVPWSIFSTPVTAQYQSSRLAEFIREVAGSQKQTRNLSP